MILSETKKPLDFFRKPEYTLINPVNTVGVMGAGVALWFKQAYPHMFLIYKELCTKKVFIEGSLLTWVTPQSRVLNFPTKRYYKESSTPALIKHGLATMDLLVYQNDTVFVTTRLGCGLGGLSWENNVRPLLESSSHKFIIATGSLDMSSIDVEDERTASYVTVRDNSFTL